MAEITQQHETISQQRKFLRLLPVIPVLTILIVTGIMGVDFGFHPDEYTNVLTPILETAQTGLLLPRNYIWPSFSYWVSLAGAVPDALAGRLQGVPSLQAYLADVLAGTPYLLRVRSLHVITASLAVLWVYLLILDWRGSWAEALVGASALGFSWEAAYHMRYVAPDAQVMSFGALTILLVMVALHKAHRLPWLRRAAIVAGLATGAKYTAGLILLPVLVLSYLDSHDRRMAGNRKIERLLQLIFIYGATVIVVTPGIVLEPLAFLGAINFTHSLYANGNWFYEGHTIAAGLPNLWQYIRYFATTLFSPYTAAALAMFGLVLVGLVDLIRRERREALVFLIFPALYFPYFSTQSIHWVRNLQIMTPFFAVLAARGAAVIWTALGSVKGEKQPAWRQVARAGQIAGAVVLAGVFVLNALWLWQAARTIQARRDMDQFAREFAAYAAGHPEDRYWLSPELRQLLDESVAELPDNVQTEQAGATQAAFLASETISDAYLGFLLDDPERGAGITGEDFEDYLTSVDPNLTETWFGPYEVNFNYYPDWVWQERIVVMRMDKAREQQLRPLRLDAEGAASTD